MINIEDMMQQNSQLKMRLIKDCRYYGREPYEHAIFYYLDRDLNIRARAEVTDMKVATVSSYVSIINTDFLPPSRMQAEGWSIIQAHNHPYGGGRCNQKPGEGDRYTSMQIKRIWHEHDVKSTTILYYYDPFQKQYWITVYDSESVTESIRISKSLRQKAGANYEI